MQTINIQETTSLHSLASTENYDLDQYDAMLVASQAAQAMPAGDNEIFGMQEGVFCFTEEQSAEPCWLQGPSDCDCKPDDKSSISKICNCAISGCYNRAGYVAAAGNEYYYYPGAETSTATFTTEEPREGRVGPKPNNKGGKGCGGCGGELNEQLHQQGSVQTLSHLQDKVNQLEAEKETLVIQVSDLRMLMHRIADEGESDLRAISRQNVSLEREVRRLKELLQGVHENSEHFNEMSALWTNHIF